MKEMYVKNTCDVKNKRAEERRKESRKLRRSRSAMGGAGGRKKCDSEAERRQEDWEVPSGKERGTEGFLGCLG